MDIEADTLKWRYRAGNSLRHNAIAVDRGRVFLVDCQPRESLIADQRHGKEVKTSPPELLCLNAKTGEVLWRNDQDIFATVLALSPEHDVLLLCGQMDLRGFQLAADRAVAHRLAAVRVSDGTRLWDATVPEEEGTYLSRPLISGRTVYAQPWAFDLLIGKRQEKFLITGRGNMHAEPFRVAATCFCSVPERSPSSISD